MGEAGAIRRPLFFTDGSGLSQSLCSIGARRRSRPRLFFQRSFAPAAARPPLFALYAFNHEVARIAETVREPMLGAIRLEWWRETVEQAAGEAPRNHDVARRPCWRLFAAHRLEPVDAGRSIIAARRLPMSSGRNNSRTFAGLEEDHTLRLPPAAL